MSWSGEGGGRTKRGQWRQTAGPGGQALLSESSLPSTSLSCALWLPCARPMTSQRGPALAVAPYPVFLCNSARKLRQEGLLAAGLGPEAKPCSEPGRASFCRARPPSLPPPERQVRPCLAAVGGGGGGLRHCPREPAGPSKATGPDKSTIGTCSACGGLGLALRRGSLWQRPGPAISSPALPFPISPFEIYPPYQGARAEGGCCAFVSSCARWPSARPASAQKRPRGRVWPWDTEGPLLSHRPVCVLCPGAPPPCPHPTPLH